MLKFGFIGMGNMAQAIAVGLISSGKVKAEDIFAYAPSQDKLKGNAGRIGISPCSAPEEAVKPADMVILACKPYQIEDVVSEIKDQLKGKAVISIAAGWQLADYQKMLDESTRVQCIMPNTPVMVGEGVLMFETDNTLEESERAELVDIMGSMGLVIDVPAALQGAGTAIAGCGPAYIDMIIEALGDAGVKHGLSRETSYKLASQMILGAAKLQLETGLHPGILKDRVCSPAGSTIRGVEALEQSGIRAAMIYAVDKAAGK
ncbi:MAG: pyrroline-5-carboxylate reductase [Firmicutes bacterium]|nr:pyrroline-5-carboxylate reductase [Bacillota bacterium]